MASAPQTAQEKKKKSRDRKATAKAETIIKDDKRDTDHLLQQAKKSPYDFVKVAFVITLPYEMLVE